MTDSGPPTIARGTALAYLYRRVGKWQWRSLLAAVVTTIGGAAGTLYQSVSGKGSASSGGYHTAMITGLAFVIAFVLFFWVRAALKKAAAIVALLIAGAAAVSYFSGVNIDTSRVKEGYDGASGWLWAQGKSLLSMVAGNFAGAISAAVGAIMGMSRGK